MPLIQSKSKKSLGQNIATEVNAGKPQKQAAAIAYSVAKKNGGQDKSPSKAPKSEPSNDHDEDDKPVHASVAKAMPLYSALSKKKK